MHLTKISRPHEDAKKAIKEKDKIIAMYHQYHTGQSIGDKNTYDLLINTSSLGIDTIETS